MKILLVAVNAKYIHSNPAVYSLRTFAGKYSEYIKIVEMTINHTEDEILKAIYLEKAEVVAFSCYIWNIEMIKRITSNLKMVQRTVKIWYGGPEVSYDAEDRLKDSKNLDGIMIGEGEQTFLELASYYVDGNSRMEDINGIAFKESAKLSEGKVTEGCTTEAGIVRTDPRKPLCLDEIPFPYANIEDFNNRIIYYESSRGCPFSCSYCLSSIEKTVRHRSLELVKRELMIFLKHKVPQVKFVDRTFNCNKQHAMEIWRFIKDNDNGITNFHFEISADLLSEEEIDFLAALRPGQVQLEIGVQSTNPDTIQAIHRKMDLNKLRANVARIKTANNIHQHLDLIAGLPYEDEESFERSFNEVYRMQPDQLQLGFLKILHGSLMEAEHSAYKVVCHEDPPYEVLSTDALDYDAVLRLKGICEMVEVYYNSAQFTCSIRYLEHRYRSPMRLYRDISNYYQSHGLSSISHSRIKRYEILLDFYKEFLEQETGDDTSLELSLMKELLIYDLYLREDLKSLPSFMVKKPLKYSYPQICQKYDLDKSTTHVLQFTHDIAASVQQGVPVKHDTTIAFDYKNRDPLTKAASVTIVEL